MPKLTPYALTFQGGLHLGTRGVDLAEARRHIPSDTLFSAILTVWRQLGGDVQAFAAPFVADPPDPPFLLTSAFPRVGRVRFYPMPADASRILSPASMAGRGKAIRKVRYLSERLFRQAQQGRPLDPFLFPEHPTEEPKGGITLADGALWMSIEELDRLPEPLQRPEKRRHAIGSLPIIRETRVPRVTVSRITHQSEVFQAGQVRFEREVGLWFGVLWRRPEAPIGEDGPTYEDALERILYVMQHDGIGGERSIGYGAFQLDPMEEVELQAASKGSTSLLLSRYHPRPDELPGALTADGAAYQIVAVDGWLHTWDAPAQRRRRVYMVTEGSLVAPPSFPAGDVVDVRPTVGHFPHPVYRYGLALAVGWGKG